MPTLMVLTHINFDKGLLKMEFIIEWRVSQTHAHLLPVAAQVPNLPISSAAPNLHDVVKLRDGSYWTVEARVWEPIEESYKLVLVLEPAQHKPDMSGPTIH